MLITLSDTAKKQAIGADFRDKLQVGGLLTTITIGLSDVSLDMHKVLAVPTETAEGGFRVRLSDPTNNAPRYLRYFDDPEFGFYNVSDLGIPCNTQGGRIFTFPASIFKKLIEACEIIVGDENELEGLRLRGALNHDMLR